MLKLTNYQIQDSHLHKIQGNLADIQQQLISKYPQKENDIRTVEEAQRVLQFIDYVKSTEKSLQQEDKPERFVIEFAFGKFNRYEDFKFLSKQLYIDEFLFDEESVFQLGVPGGVTADLIESYKENFDNLLTDLVENHKNTQKFLKEEFSSKTLPQHLECGCQECISFYRTKVRDEVVKSYQARLEEIVEELQDDILDKSVGEISNKHSREIKKIEFEIKKSRLKLRKSSYNKVFTGFKDEAEKVFSLNKGSEIAKVYVEKVKAFLFSEVEEVKPEFYSEQDLASFFEKLRLNLWRNPTFLKREFSRHTKYLLMLKRKDISSSILVDYLGQFWLHSDARRINRKIIYHMGPTNSGKTYHAINALAEVKKGCYLAPLRLLAGENFDRLNDLGVKTSLLTGEEVIEVDGATHYSSTIEMAKLHEKFDCVVIDEIQMISDKQRGWAWTRALVSMYSPEIHLCGDPSVLSLVEQILKLTGDELEIKTYDRMTALEIERNPTEIKNLKRGDALIVFSRRNALKQKIELEKLNHKVSIVYGMLNPDVRREQARRFDVGETDIIVATDAISMGMNLPIRRIVFSAFSKFINSTEYPLTDSEIKQISGRAGRYGRFPTGYVTYLDQEKNDGGYQRLQQSLDTVLEEKDYSMVGPDLNLFLRVNNALSEHSLSTLKLSEFLRLFYTINFQKPFMCVQLDEMIEITEMVEEAEASSDTYLLPSEIFGFACAPVNLGLIDHVQYFHSIVTRYIKGIPINNEYIDTDSSSIDYLETSIKCVELYQWLARHFDNKNFDFDAIELMKNKLSAVERLNKILSEKTIKYYNPHKHPMRRNRNGNGGTGGEERQENRKRRFNKKKGFKKSGNSHRSDKKHSGGKKFKRKARSHR